MKAVVIFKINDNMAAIGYITMSNSDFNKKIKEITQNGFVLMSEDTTSNWYYEKGDVIVTAGKKLLTIQGKDFLRYEIDIAGFKTFNK